MPEAWSEKIEKFEKFSNATETENTNNTNSRKSCNIIDANENKRRKTKDDVDICSSNSSNSSSSNRSRSSSMNGVTLNHKARQDHYNPSIRLLKIDKLTNGVCGFHLTRSKWDPYPWVSAVDSNTPAELSGLRAGDCVLEVNDEDVLGLRISQIAELVKEASDHVTLLLWSCGIDPNCDAQSICCGPMPTNLRRLSIIVQNILSIIECPVCLDTISPPAMQCQNGHLLCLNCRIRAEKCPVCRDRYTPRRALIAEQIYTAFANAFNLCRDEDKMRLKLFGPNARQPEPSAKWPEAKETKQSRKYLSKAKSAANSAATTPTLMSGNKFLTKLMDKACSMDNITSSCSMSNNSHGLVVTATAIPTVSAMLAKAATTATTISTATNSQMITTEMQSTLTNQLHETNKVGNHLTSDGIVTVAAAAAATNVSPATSNMMYKHHSISANDLSQDGAQNITQGNHHTLQRFAVADSIAKSLSPMFSNKHSYSNSLNESLECLPPAESNINSSSLSASATSLITATTSSSVESSGIYSCSDTSNDSYIKNEILSESIEESTTISAAATATAAAAATVPLSSILLSVVLSTSASSPTVMSAQGADLPVATLLSAPSIVALESTQTQTDNLPMELVDCSKNSCSMQKLKKENNFRCPCNCGKIFNASSELQRHVKVDHQMPILSFGASSAEFALPLQQPLDNAVLVLEICGDAQKKAATAIYEDVAAGAAGVADDEKVKCDDKRCIKECWIRFRATKENGRNRCILLTALLQGSANEDSDFMLGIQVSGHCETEVGNFMKSNAIRQNEAVALTKANVRKNDNIPDGNATKVKFEQQQQLQLMRSMQAATWNKDFDSINQCNCSKNNNVAVFIIDDKTETNTNNNNKNKKNEFIPCLSGNVEGNKQQR